MTMEAVGSIRILELDNSHVDAWDAFVEGHAQATFFHKAAWKKIIESQLGHAVYGLYAEQAGEIQGVLMLGHVRSRLFGNALISNPFVVYGGIVANTPAAEQALDAAAHALGTRLGVDYIEYRNLQSRHPNRPRKDLYVTFRKEIDPDPEVNLLRIPRKQRAMIRKGEQAGLISEIDAGIDRFYDLYAENLRCLGTPIQRKAYFSALHDEFSEACDVLTITLDGQPISSVMSFYFRNEVLPYYAGANHAARAVKANDFMYWELMRRSCLRGIRIFDYGRSKQGTGSYSFKKNWGFEPEPLYYEYDLLHAKAMPDISPVNPKYSLFIEAWKRLPLPVTRWIGPHIARNLG